MLPRIGVSDLQFLADNGFVVVENFLPNELHSGLINDLKELRAKNGFRVAKIGQDGMVQDESTPFRDIRFSETCSIGRQQQQQQGTSSDARCELHRVLDALRKDLNAPLLRHAGRFTRNVPELDPDLEELMYAHYPKGGYYRRHMDAEPNSMSNWRRYSFLLYLAENEWPASYGGQLRIHRDSGGDSLPPGELPNFVDVLPRGKTLVLFRSNVVPHEVLDTYHERMAIVGWFLSKEAPPPNNDNNTTSVPIPHSPIHPQTLKALRELRRMSPKLKSKLEPSTNQTKHNQNQQSGLLGDDFFGFASPQQHQQKEEEQKEEQPPIKYNDMDPAYWKPIATFDVDGHITTLSLHGQRLRSAVGLFGALLGHVVTLDLGNTDLSPSQTAQILASSNPPKNLHLAGNSIDNDGMAQIIGVIVVPLQVLDLRYNNIGVAGSTSLASFLSSSSSGCEVLHMEGNQLGDEGVRALLALDASNGLRELYLGQNNIGPVGAASIGRAMPVLTKLKKLYLDGNHIGSDGARALRIALEEQDDDNKVLEKLYVENNNIQKEEALLLGKALSSVTMIGSSAFFD